MTFLELGLNEPLLQAVTDMGFVTPMPIQEQTIPLLLANDTDFVGLAQTGTGKTCAYGLPLLQKVDIDIRQPQSVVLCPTRELCIQIVQEMRHFGANLKKFRAVAVYGGVSVNNQVADIRRGVQMIVATPGRMLDLMQRGVIELEQVKTLVLDEADEMLDMGFKEELDQIVKALPYDKHTWMFSATMSKEVEEIASAYLRNPEKVTIGTKNQTAENITHECYVVKQQNRYPSLRRLLDMNPDIYALIFRRTKHETQELCDALIADGYPVDAIHGDLSQAARETVMKRFRSKQLRILIATDVAARGIDVDDITHIIHYDLPDDLEVYTHRSGRTARAGKSGFSIAFVSPAERYRLGQLERRLHIHFNAKLVPDGVEVCRQRLVNLAQQFKNPELTDAAKKYYADVMEAFDTVTREDIIKGLLASELKNIDGEHVSHQDLNAAVAKPKFKKEDRPPRAEREDRPPREEKAPRRDDVPMQAFEINVGTIDHINPGAIVRLICEYGEISSSQIGYIKLGEETSFFEVVKEVADKVRHGLSDGKGILDGEPVEIRDVAEVPQRDERPPRRRYGGHGRDDRGHGRYGRGDRGGRGRYDRDDHDYARRDRIEYGRHDYDSRPHGNFGRREDSAPAEKPAKKFGFFSRFRRHDD